MVTTFDRVRVEGPFAVEVTTGGSPNAVARGDARALDAVDIKLEDRTLVVRGSPNGWGGWPGERSARPTVAVSVPHLVAISLQGSGGVRIDAMRGAEVSIALTGSGRIDVARIETDRLDAAVVGSGALGLAGTARTARLTNSGVGTIDAGALSVRDLVVQSESAGDSRVTATQTASVIAAGMGGVTIDGPAACTRAGPGPIDCRIER